MNFKRYVEASDTWVDSHYIMGTDTDTITTLPAVIHPTGTTATVGLKGNTVQSDNPVMPQGTGERTGNLFDKESLNIINNRYLRYNGELDASSNHIVSDFMLISGTYITISNTGVENTSHCFYDSNKDFISSFKLNEIPKTIEIPSNAKFIRCTVPKKRRDDFMLNIGSTALPYEPYGIKIPISSASTTTPVYLGEVETTRRIKKLVLTGEESLTVGNNCFVLWLYIVHYPDPKQEIIYCTHYKGRTPTYRDSLTNGQCMITKNQNQIAINDSSYATVDDFKSYLASQYAAGTPVTVWYVLATPETAVVNEPLMKIGDNADEVSGITIPVTAGGDTLSVDTTVQPSEVTATYKGWHPAIVHERTNGAWT